MTDQPSFTAQHVIRGTSLRRRVGYLVAGMGGLAGATLVGILWATEPAPLPARTRLAFAVFVLIGLAWTGFAVWALARRPLFAVDRVVAGTLAVAFSLLTTAGTVALAMTRGSDAAVLIAGGLGLGLTTVSAVILARARNHRANLIARLRELQRRGESGEPRPAADRPALDQKPAPRLPPLGPLALALRHLPSGPAARRHAAMLALVLGVAALVGLTLLLLR